MSNETPLAIRRVSALPAPLVANTIYLLAAAPGKLKVVVAGNTVGEVATSADETALYAYVAEVLTSYYTKSQVNTLLNSYSTKVETAAAIATAISGLDIVSPVKWAEDIAERDALAVTATKDILVLVGDATADATVDAGSALYFYELANTAWHKVAEFESMDVIIPNKSILEKLSVDEKGNLLYDGAAIGGVVQGAHEW